MGFDKFRNIFKNLRIRPRRTRGGKYLFLRCSHQAEALQHIKSLPPAPALKSCRSCRLWFFLLRYSLEVGSLEVLLGLIGKLLQKCCDFGKGPFPLEFLCKLAVGLAELLSQIGGCGEMLYGKSQAICISGRH